MKREYNIINNELIAPHYSTQSVSVDLKIMRSVNTMHWKATYGTFLILTAYLTIPVRASSTMSTVYATEGAAERLQFPFPCCSAEVTLRHGYQRLPFYSLTSQGENLISSHHNITIQNDTGIGSDECFLHFTIHNITRGDEGTYILIAYKNGAMLPDYPTIELRVEYPPGKVSCEPKNYCGDWIRLQCTAKAGRTRSSGEIVCFQSGCRMPPLTTPKVQDGTLSQTILAKSDADHVHCCSSQTDQVKDICECKDWGWNPIHNTLNITDPCPDVVSTEKDPAPLFNHMEDIGIPSTQILPQLTPVPLHQAIPVSEENLNDSLLNCINVIIGLLILLIVLFIFLLCALHCFVPAVKANVNKLLKKISYTWSGADSGLKTKQQGYGVVADKENP